jgi:hypothetical protein
VSEHSVDKTLALENYTFLTSEMVPSRPNVHAGRKRQFVGRISNVHQNRALSLFALRRDNILVPLFLFELKTTNEECNEAFEILIRYEGGRLAANESSNCNSNALEHLVAALSQLTS